MLRLVLYGAAFLTLFVAWQGFRTYRLLNISAELVKEAKPFERKIPNASMRILVAGDSIGVGVGASKNEFSMAGRLSAYYPDASIENISVSGATLADILKNLEKAEGKYDLVYLHGGANDVIGRTSYVKVRSDASALFAKAKELGGKVIILESGSVGFAPFFPQPLDWYYTDRTLKTYAVVVDEAKKAGVTYVSLYKPRGEDPFVKDPKRLFAPDQFHPSDDGYALWFAELAEALR